MPLNFPSNPGIGQTYGLGERLWTYSGEGWVLTPQPLPEGPQGIQGVQGTTVQGAQGIQGAILSPTGGIPVASNEPERVFYISQSSITTSYTVPSGFNALSVGPHTIGIGVTVTIPAGSTWIVIEPT